MKVFPDNLESYKRTPEFTETTVPPALKTSHRTKEGSWAEIVVLDGEILYRILEPYLEETILSRSKHGVVEPMIKHEVEVVGPVRFYVQFFRETCT